MNNEFFCKFRKDLKEDDNQVLVIYTLKDWLGKDKKAVYDRLRRGEKRVISYFMIHDFWVMDFICIFVLSNN